MATRTEPVGSFRVPNSLIQGLTTTTAAELNQLTAFQTVTLLGLLTRVPSDRPGEEVRTTPSELLDVIAVSKSVAQVVDREWERTDGSVGRKRYHASRYSPRYQDMIHAALQTLFEKSVVVRRDRGNKVFEERVVHILDSFGYEFVRDGRTMDPDRLPAGYSKVNVGSTDRPVFRVRRTDCDGAPLRARAVVFRLNRELAAELRGERDTIMFTVLAGKLFGLLKTFMKQPAAIRLALLVLRQTGPALTRKLQEMLCDLGFDVTHPARAVAVCRQVLGRLADAGLILNYELDVEGNRLHCQIDRSWHKEDGRPQQPAV